jgi:hypothetical protein
MEKIKQNFDKWNDLKKEINFLCERDIIINP